MKSGNIILIVSFLIICSILTLYLVLNEMKAKDKPTLQEIDTNELVADNKMDPELRAQEDKSKVSAWEKGTGLFQTNTDQPLLLFIHEEFALYVQHNRLQLLSYGETPITLLTWESPQEAQVWVNDTTMLIGVHSNQQSDILSGNWYTLDLDIIGTESKETSDIIQLDTTHFGPRQVELMQLTNDPELFFLTVKYQTGNYGEFVYIPDSEDFMYVNGKSLQEFFPPPDSNGYMSSESASRKPDVFDNHERFIFPEGTIHIFKDKKGSIVYFNQPFLYVWRFFDLEAIDFKMFTDQDGHHLPLGRFRDSHGREVASVPNWGSSSNLPYEPKIWEDGWNMVDLHSFYKVEEDHIHVIKFEYDTASSGMVKTIDKTILTSPARYVSKSGTLLSYNLEQKRVYLSIYDVMHSRTDHQDGQIESLWLHTLPEGEIEREKRELPSWNPITLTLPKIPVFYSNTNTEIPQEIYDALNRLEQYGGSGDYGPDTVFRKLDNTWYVLVDNRLYEYEQKEFKEIGTLPVQLTSSIGEGVSGWTAQDYTKVERNWIVADTLGNRLLKLNHNLDIVKEYSIKIPSEISITSDHQLQVKNLQGWTTLTLDFEFVQQEGVDIKKVRASDVEEREIPAHSVYEDKKTGWIWYYIHGNVYRYNTRKNEYTTVYVGHTKNARAQVRIIPYQNNVFVLSDESLHIFNEQGKWQRTMSFPRVTPDGIYTSTSEGENSYYLDEKNNKLYLVQGFRILEINIKSGETKSIFFQPYANISKILYDKGRIYFTLHPNIEERFHHQFDPAKSITEIVVLDLKTNKSKRFITDGYYYLDRIADNDVQLWIFDYPWYSSNEGTRKTFSLNMFD